MKTISSMRESARLEVPDLWIEQYRLGELPSEKQSRVEALPDFKHLMQELDNEDAKFTGSAEFEKALIAIKAETEEKQSKLHIIRFKPTLRSLSFVAAGFVLFSLGFTLIRTQTELSTQAIDVNEITRTKGDGTQLGQTQLSIYKQTNDNIQALEPSDTVKAFDRLQISYTAAGQPFGIIISFDGNRQATLHFPESVLASSKLDQNDSVLLPYAYQLDDSPAFESFYFITSSQEIKVQDIWPELTKLAKNDLWQAELQDFIRQRQLKSTSFTLIKE